MRTCTANGFGFSTSTGQNKFIASAYKHIDNCPECGAAPNWESGYPKGLVPSNEDLVRCENCSVIYVWRISLKLDLCAIFASNPAVTRYDVCDDIATKWGLALGALQPYPVQS